MNFAEFKIIKEIEKTIDENFKLIRNTKGGDYPLKDHWCPENKSLFTGSGNYMEYILSHTESIKEMYGSLENYLEEIKKCPKRLESINSDIEDIKELYKQIGELRDKDVSCHEVQKLILEVDNYNKKMMGVGMKEMTKSRDLFKNGSQELSDEMAKQVEEYTKSYIKKHD